MATDPATLLSECEAAISAILTGGQAIGTNGRTLTMADLGALQKFRAALKDEMNTAAAGGGRMTSLGTLRDPS